MSFVARHTVFSARSKIRSVGFDVISKHAPLIACTSHRGEIYVVKAGDEWIGRGVFVDGEFDFAKFEQALATIARHRPNWSPELLVDIGANIGTICIPAVRRGLVERALAIEPEADNVRLLRANILLNRLEDRVIPIHSAAGAKDGETLQLECDGENFGDHRIRVTEQSGLQGETDRQLVSVPSSSLDTLIKGQPLDRALIWMDVQGYEGFVLTGAPATLASKPPIVLEFSPYLLNRAGSFSALCEALAHYEGFIDLSSDRGLRPIAELTELNDSFKGTSFTDILVV
jgi:FkbM family methyltransferase